jgi:hypothetical protein
MTGGSVGREPLRPERFGMLSSVFLYMLIYKNLIAVRVNNRKTGWPFFSSDRGLNYLYSFRLKAFM